MNPRFPYLRRLFPQSLGGQLLVMLLLALAITQGLGLLLLTDERNRAVRAALGWRRQGAQRMSYCCWIARPLICAPRFCGRQILHWSGLKSDQSRRRRTTALNRIRFCAKSGRS